MKKILIIAMFLSVFAHSASAAVIKQNENDGICVSGKVDNNSSKEVIVSIIGPFDTKMRYDEAVEDIDKIYVNATYADENMEYAFSYKPIINNKFYAISVTNSGVQETAEIFFADNVLIQSVLSDINSANDIEVVFDKREYEDVLINNYSDFQTLNKTQRERVYSDILKNKNNEYADFEEFESVYLKAIAVQKINNAKSGEEIKRISDVFLPISNVSLYDEYKNYSELEKINVFERMVNEDFSDIEAFYSAVNESIFLEKIESEEFSTNLTDFITKNAEEIGIDISDYPAVANKVNSKINKKFYKTIDEFEEDFKMNIKSAKTPSGGKGGSGSSGGGNTKPSGTYLTPMVETPKQTVKFDDLDGVAWAQEAILALFDKGVVSGKESRKFYPHDFVTREEFVKMVVGAFDIKGTETGCTFEDVSEDKWYYSFVCKAVDVGIINGFSQTQFGVGMNITRQDIATILYRIAEKYNVSLAGTDNMFTDHNDISDYAKDAVYALRQAGVIYGVGANCFVPKNNATRAEAAKMIYEMLEVIS